MCYLLHIAEAENNDYTIDRAENNNYTFESFISEQKRFTSL